jgi:hypothetical protein
MGRLGWFGPGELGVPEYDAGRRCARASDVARNALSRGLVDASTNRATTSNADGSGCPTNADRARNASGPSPTSSPASAATAAVVEPTWRPMRRAAVTAPMRISAQHAAVLPQGATSRFMSDSTTLPLWVNLWGGSK